MTQSPAWEIRYKRQLTPGLAKVCIWNPRLNLSLVATVEGNWERVEAGELTEDSVTNVRIIQ